MSKIKTLLKRLGTPKLISLYGNENVEAITNILHDGVNEVKLVDLLFIKYGKQLLAKKAIRLAILTRLTDQERGYILDGNNIPDKKLSRDELEKLSKMTWGRKNKASLRFIEVLDLDDDYLPPLYQRPPSKVTIIPKTQLFPHQRRIKDNITRSLIRGDRRLLVHMPTGAGKTRTSIEAIIDFWKTSLDRNTNLVWLAHSEELCEQAVETFTKLWEIRGDQEITLLRAWGDHDTPEFHDGNNFIVASFQKLYSMISSNKDKYFKAINLLKRSCSFIIVDEAHKAIAPTYKICISYLFNEGVTKLVGLTATPGRAKEDIDENNLNITQTDELVSFFDSNKITLTDEKGYEIENPIEYLQENGFLAKIKRRKVATNVDIQLTEKEREFVANFLEVPKTVLKRLASNDERNALILGEVAALRLKKCQIILFAVSVEHAHLLTELLNLKGISAKCIDGATSPPDRAEAIERYKNNEINVLVNYGVLTTGFDAPNTNAVVITRPTASLVLYSQMIGRGNRGVNECGNAECSLID